MGDATTWSDEDLVYAADSRCPCGAGLAYIRGAGASGCWDCSAILTGRAVPAGEPGAVEHTDRLPFTFWKVRSEQESAALGEGRTTRPGGSIPKTVSWPPSDGYLGTLLGRPIEDLANDLYNRRVADLADYDGPFEGEHDKRGHGKRIPYLGWFWRDCDFVRGLVAIGRGPSFVGVMESNKWGYPGRMMTPGEVATFVDFLERAFARQARGGTASDTLVDVEATCDEMWSWFQTLRIG